MTVTTLISRTIIDEEPTGSNPVQVHWTDEGWISINQDNDSVLLRPECAAAVAQALTDALTDSERPSS